MKSLTDAIGNSGLEDAAEAPRKDARASLPQLARQDFVSTRPATERDRRLALAAVALSALVFLAAIPFAKQPLTPLWAFIPSYQAALVVLVACLTWVATAGEAVLPAIMQGNRLHASDDLRRLERLAGVDIEITESLLMTQVDESIRKLRELREMGLRMALDDFGTGYSSLA